MSMWVEKEDRANLWGLLRENIPELKLLEKERHILIEDFVHIVLVLVLIVFVVRDDFSFLLLVVRDVEDAFVVDIPSIPRYSNRAIS